MNKPALAAFWMPFTPNRQFKATPRPGLDRVFLVNSGSEGIDTALKVALAHAQARGEGQRCLFIGRGEPEDVQRMAERLRQAIEDTAEPHTHDQRP
jgi:4-aminobutyrate aminotransferase-like enzyme